MSDPFDVLGVPPSASADEIRRARRELAKHAHPDAGGDADAMQRLNAAAAAALRMISGGGATTSDEAAAPSTPSSGPVGEWDGTGQRRDAPSFTVEALPVETFEALLLAAAVLGEVEHDDPPYELGVLLGQPLSCWCRLDVVPDAGASTVSVSIAAAADAAMPPIEVVRNAWIAELNALDWSDLSA